MRQELARRTEAARAGGLPLSPCVGILRGGLELITVCTLLAIVVSSPIRAEVEEPAAESAEAPAYDPFSGMDRNGRIPKVEYPADIQNPDRWRYIPEGRIKPGNVFQRLLVTSFIIPFIFSDGDIGTGFGLGLTDIDFRLQRRREFMGLFLSYTTKGQQRYGVVWRRWLKTRELPSGGIIQEERSFVGSRFDYRKTLTRRYFGLGPDTTVGDESSYTDQAWNFSLKTSFSLEDSLDDFIVDLEAAAEFHRLFDGVVSGVDSTATAYPEEFAAAEEWNVGIISVGLRWDRRDSQRNPYRGWNVGVRSDTALAQTDGNVGAVFSIFGSKIFPVPGLFHRGGDAGEAHPPTDVLAFGFMTQHSAGTLPFFLLPTLGGRNTLRGYIDGRWRDRSSWHLSSEYRFWVIARGFPITRNIRVERIGLAGFYEVGAVASGFVDIFSASPAQSYGVGLRISLERAALFRLDIGFSDEDKNFSAGFGLTF